MKILNIHFLVFSIFFMGLVTSCEQNQSDSEYKAEIEQWHSDRIDSLKEEDSWLSLIGLYSLEEGTYSFGSDSVNDFVFPPKASPNIGTITRNGDTFNFDIRPRVKVTTSNGDSINELKTGADGDSHTLNHGNLQWHIIGRRGNYYLRLKDTNHPNFSTFNGIERFPVSRKWKVEATFNRFNEPREITIPDILGKEYQDSLYGMLEFTINGEDYSLAPLGHPDNDEEFFIIFGDQTNGDDTYGGGRYIYIPTPENGTTYIDFNKAYNPPCVFTEYATCPLPPPENQLDVAVTAGEKMYE